MLLRKATISSFGRVRQFGRVVGAQTANTGTIYQQQVALCEHSMREGAAKSKCRIRPELADTTPTQLN